MANFKKPIAKRRVALLRSMSHPEEAISALVKLLDMSPTDAEAWSEVSDLYLSQGLYQQAIFSLEEVLLITPNAWNVSSCPDPQLKPHTRVLSCTSVPRVFADNRTGSCTDG